MATKNMAARKGKMTTSSSSLSDHTAEQALDDLRMQNSKLRAELDVERSSIKQLKHEKSHQAKVIRDEEQTRANIALKDVKMRIVQEKAKELDSLKDSLHRKFDADLQKVTKQKDAEIQKLQNDLKKCQNELSEVTKRGLSGAARGVFEAEREKMLHELQELRAAKRSLEESLQEAVERDRQKMAEQKRLVDLRKNDLAKAKKDSDIEIRKLLDELRSKERTMAQLEREVGAQSIDATKLRMEKESMQDLLSYSWDSDTWQDRSPRRANSVSSVASPDGDTTPDVVRIMPAKEDAVSSGNMEKERKLQHKISELNAKVRRLDDQSTALAQDKADLVKRIKELEKGRKPLQEKNRKFLEKNMSLTVIKRNLEEKLEKLSEETAKLRSQADHNKNENQKLSEQLSFEKLERSSYEKMVQDMDSLQRQTEEHEKTIEALQLACTEKDRRIELIVQRRRKQRNNKAQQKVVRFLLPARPRPGAAGIKETYYGYDDDSRSVDSELSSSSRLSSSRQSLDTTIDDDGDDNVFEEFTREQYAQNYQRLAAEHLELERSFALLQSQGVHSHVDPQREAKDTGWIKEKEKLNKELRSLKEKFAEREDTEDKLKLQLSEMEEENEVMEFRVLELEDANEKLKEEARYTVTFTLPPAVTDDGVLQIYAEEKGIMEIGAAELRERLEHLRTSQEVCLSVEDKVALVQAAAMLNIADKKFKELKNTLSALWERIHQLEEGKARLLSDATGVSAEVVLEYESVNNQLIAAHVQISELKQEVENYKKEKAIFEYTNAIYGDTEKRYKSDVASLQRQLSSSTEGRDYETEIISTRLDQLKELEQRLCAVEASRAELEAQIRNLTEENSELSASNRELLEQVNNLIEENTAIHSSYTELLEQAESSHSKELLEHTESSHGKEQDDSGLPVSKKEHSVQVDNLSQCSSDSGVGPREQVEHLTRESGELRAQNKELQVQVEALKQSSCELHQSKTEFYSQSNKQLLEELESVNVEKCKLRLNNKELQEQVDSLSKEKHSPNEELFAQLESLSKSNSELQSSNKELLIKVESFNENYSKVQTRNKELLAQVESLNESYSKLQTSNKELLAQVETLNESYSKLQTSNKELLAQVESFNESNFTLQTRNKELLAQVESFNERNSELQTSNKELLGQVESLSESNSTLQTSNKELLGQVESLTESNSTLQTGNKALLGEVERLNEEISQLPKTKTEQGGQAAITQTNGHEKADIELSEKNNQSNAVLKQKLAEYEAVKCDQTEANHRLEANLRELSIRCTCMATDLLKAREEIKALKQHQLTSPVVEEVKCNNSSVGTQTLIPEAPEVTPSRPLLSSCDDYIEADIGSSTSESGYINMSQPDDTHSGDTAYLKGNIVELVRQKEELETEVWKLKAELDSKKETLQECCGEKEQQQQQHSERAEQLSLELHTLTEQLEQWRQKAEELETSLRDTRSSEGRLLEQLHLLRNDTSRRVDSLQSKVVDMEENKLQLGETVTELRTIEAELRAQIVDCAETSRASDSEHEIPQRIKQLEMSEDQLREKIDAVEAKLQQYQCSSDAQNDIRTCELRIVELEALLRVSSEDGNRLRATLETQNEQIRSLEVTEQKLTSELIEAAEVEKKLLMQMELLQDAEEKLMEKVSTLEGEEEALRCELSTVRDSNMACEVGERELQGRVDELRRTEKELRETVERLEARKTSLETRYEEETDKLHNKLDLLLESEEKLLDRLQEQEQVEEEMKKEMKKSAQELEQVKSELAQQSRELDNAKKEIEVKQIELEAYRHDMHTLSREKAKSEMELEKVKVDLQSAKTETSHMVDQVKLLEAKMSKNDTTEETWMDYSRQRIEELECHEKQLKDCVNELEKSEAVLQMQVSSIEAAKKELSESENHLREEVNEQKMVAMSLKNTIRDLEKSESSLKTQVSNVESQNKELLTMVRSLQDKVAPSPYRLGHTSECARSPVYFDLVDGMTREEMSSKIHELTRLERFHRAKITALSENLGLFREAVEVVTVTMETNAGGLVTEGKPRVKDSELELRINEIVSMEVELKQKVAEWEKMAAAYKHQLGEAESALIEQEAEHRREQEILEEEIDARRKGEARLKNQLQYGGDCCETDALAKIQHLEELVFDLETSERKLKRRLQDLEVNERKMTNKLAEMEKTAVVVTSKGHDRLPAGMTSQDHDQSSGVMTSQDHDRLSGLLEQLRKAESSEQNMKEKLLRGESDMIVALRHQVAQLEESRHSSYEREDSATVSALRHHVAQLEQSERGLRMKLRMLESSQEMTALERDSMLVDSPEAVLKRRIQQLEGMERYMKQQLAELERDREELHEIARRDKNTIHELTVQLRASQLSEKSLKDQVNRLEQQERHLVSKNDSMAAMMDELQEKLRSLQLSEQDLKVALQKQENNDSEVAFKLSNVEADLESMQQKLLSKMGELENEKREHYNRCNELTDRIGDLEGIELTLKQKVRSLEGREASYESRILDLEQLESAAQLRIIELESLNENLSLRLRSTDDGRSSLMYEVTDLERSREKQQGDIEELQMVVRDLREQLDDSQRQCRDLEDRLEETRDVEPRLLTELSELKERHDVVSSNLSKEAEFLTEQLNFHKRTLQRVEDENLLLRDKLSLYECSVANNQMASVPRSELSWLRSQEELQAALEEKARRLEQSEAYLKATVAELRIGKDVCGHDLELERLKNQVKQYNTLLQERDGLRKALTSMKKAHKLLKENSESLKQELREWQQKMKSGVVSVLREKVNVNSKSVQVTLADSVTLKRLSANEILYAMEHSEEFRSSLRNLSVNHPTAYQDFVKLMQPTECNISHIRVMGDDQFPTATTNGSQFELQRVPDPTLSPGDTDDIMMSMNFFDETDEERSERSDSSSHRHTHCAVPPLPICLPPPASTLGGMESSNSSYYLPSPRRDDDTASADEASEIADEDDAGGIPVKKASSKLSDSSQMRSVDRGLSRARSVDRDSFGGRSVDRDARSVDRDYSEGSQLVLGGSNGSQKYSDMKLSASLDSIPDSGLSTLHQEADNLGVKAMIADFERQIKSRDHELETLRSTHRDGGAREHGHEELVSIKAKLEERERDMTEKKEEIVKMRSQMDTMHSLLQSKNIVLGEDGHYETLKETDNTATTKHLVTKTNKVEKLSKELHQWQLDCWAARDKLTKTEQTLNVVQHELDTLRTLTDQHTQLQWQFDTLTREHKSLVAEKEKWLQSGQETATLEKIVLKLRGQLKTLERVDLERQELAIKVKAAEEEIKEKSKREKQLLEDNAQLQRRIESLQAELKQLHHTVDRRGTVDSKHDAAESVREKAMMTITPLRAKVIRLASKCRAKDDLIGCLSRELRRSGGPTDLVAMAEREQTEGTTEDYDRPISPLTSAAIESFGGSVNSKEAAQMAAASSPRSASTRLSQRQCHHQSMSTNNLDDVATEEDAEIDALMSSDLASLSRSSSSHKTFPGRLDRSKSTPNCNVEFYDLSPLTLPPVTNRVREKMRGARRLLQQQQGGSTSKKDLYRAVKDYNPVYFSCSGRPELDLAFNEADILTVLGPVDETGYYEAELQGRRGLVPASYLLPLYPHAPTSSPRKYRRQTLHSSRVDLSPEQTPHRLLSSAPVTPTSDLRDFPARTHKFKGAHPAFSGQLSALPAAVTPRSTRPGSHPAFQSPTPGGAHFSGASTLPRAHRRLPSPAIQSPPPLDTSQAVPLASPIDDGQPDAPTNFHIERIVGSHSVLLCWMTPKLDEFGHNNGSRVEGYKICIDSRDRLTVTSAHLTKALVEQLDLHKSHSFSIQTVAENGKMSAIVSVLFHEVAPQLVGRSSAGEEGISEHGSTPGSSPRKLGDGRDTLRERRVFMAVYDYTPCKLSALTRPRQELSFRTGDIIITYGPPGTDGFYYGKVHGKKGYIPASFIEEIALLKSKSRRSVSTNSLVSQHSASSVASATKRSRPLNLGISTDV